MTGVKRRQIVAQHIHSTDVAQGASGLDLPIHNRSPSTVATGHATDHLIVCRLEPRRIVLRLPSDLTGYNLMTDRRCLHLWLVRDRRALGRGQCRNKIRSGLGPGYGDQCRRGHRRPGLGPCVGRLLRKRYCHGNGLWCLHRNCRLLRHRLRRHFRNGYRHGMRDIVRKRDRTRGLPRTRRYVWIPERHDDRNSWPQWRYIGRPFPRSRLWHQNWHKNWIGSRRNRTIARYRDLWVRMHDNRLRWRDRGGRLWELRNGWDRSLTTW